MKIVAQNPNETLGRTRILTQAIRRALPSTMESIDALAILALCAIALLGFATTFEGYHFYVSALLGVALGVASGLVLRNTRWSGLILPLPIIGLYFLVGPGLALRNRAYLGLLPMWETTTALAELALSGWKQMLTTLPPLEMDGIYVGLPYLLGLIAGSVGFLLARSSRHPILAMVVPAGLFGATILLGTLQTFHTWALGLGFALVSLCWLVYRFRHRSTLVGTGSSGRWQLVASIGMLLGALMGGYAIGILLPQGGPQRLILRTYVDPPLDLSTLASPLEAFRKYSSEGMNKFYDQELLKVDGAKDQALLRLAVMDDYSGRNWTATSGGVEGIGFQRIGSTIPNIKASGKKTVRITIRPAYAANTDGSLNVWIPTLGETSNMEFLGSMARAHQESFRFNINSMQGIISDRFKGNDVIRVTSESLPTPGDKELRPGSSPIIDASKLAFIAQVEKKWSGDASTQWDRLMAVSNTLKGGYWSDGTREGEKHYLPGHGQRRISDFIHQPQLVGSDEQYAATLALMANHIGFPARVVLGTVIPSDGVVKGKDVSAWVEVQTDRGWVTIAPSTFIPSRNKRPQQTPQQASKDSAAMNVPPPNPARAPGSLDQLSDGLTNVAGLDANAGQSQIWGLIGAIALYAGTPLGIIILLVLTILLAKALRSRRRSTRGTPARQIALGWRDLVDRARDMGIEINYKATRLEQSNSLGPSATAVAVAANSAIFGYSEPDSDMSQQVWAAVKTAKSDLLKQRRGIKKLWARLSLRSFLPRQ